MTAPRTFSFSWESLFIDEARSEGHSEEYIKTCLEYASALRSKNLPIIFDIRHLAIVLNSNEEVLKQNNFNAYYRNYLISKKNGRGYREINTPTHWLKKVQSWIYVNILLKDPTVRPEVYSFLPNGYSGRKSINIRENASGHQNRRWLLSIDIKNFFPSIKTIKIKTYFSSLGYTPEVAEVFTRLCVFKQRLPQGAPTSPMLSNIVTSPLDDTMLSLAKEYNAHYTRYADDITFSGDENVVPIDRIISIIKSNGLFPNHHKTKLRFKGQRQTVTGLTISNGVHVPKAYRREVERELYFCEKFGIESHIESHRKTLKSPQGFYKEWLLGRIMFIRMIEPERGERMLFRFNRLNWL